MLQRMTKAESHKDDGPDRIETTGHKLGLAIDVRLSWGMEYRQEMTTEANKVLELPLTRFGINADVSHDDQNRVCDLCDRRDRRR